MNCVGMSEGHLKPCACKSWLFCVGCTYSFCLPGVKSSEAGAEVLGEGRCERPALCLFFLVVSQGCVLWFACLILQQWALTSCCQVCVICVFPNCYIAEHEDLSDECIRRACCRGRQMPALYLGCQLCRPTANPSSVESVWQRHACFF